MAPESVNHQPCVAARVERSTKADPLGTKVTTTPNKNDVLLGKGSLFQNHVGNIQFRSIVETRKQEYLDAHHSKKKGIVLSIIREIESMEPPGRFLECKGALDFKGKEGGADKYERFWEPVNEDKAAAKVGHCLREKKTGKKKKSTCTNTNEPSIEQAASGGNEKTLARQLEVLPHHHNTENQTTQIQPDNIMRAGCEENVSLGTHEYNTDTPSMQRSSTILDGSLPLIFEGDDEQPANFIPLREWINNTVKEVDVSSLAHESHFCTYGTNTSAWPLDVKLSLAASSDFYRNQALEVALSLANQIYNAEEAHRNQCLKTGQLPFLPSLEYNWAERICVHPDLSSICQNHYLDLEPLDASVENRQSFGPTELEALLKSTTDVDYFEESGKAAASGELTCNISVARLLPPLSSLKVHGSLQDESQRIYHLGLVFYELFSGGRAPLGSKQCARVDDEEHDITGNCSIDLAHRLVISDDYSGHTNGATGSQCKSKRGRSGHDNDSNDAISSSAALTVHGLPTSLCDLIDNMLDCANGDVIGDETYRHMVDVKDDLQRMIGNPDKFLRDLDMETLSKTGLQLNHKFYGQEKELSSLKAWYDRPYSENDEFVVITGEAGVGKSVLAYRFAEIVSSTGGIFLSAGKFDQFQHATPFSTILSALDQYCGILISGQDSHHITTITRLRAMLGNDMCDLARLIPNLRLLILDELILDEEDTDQNDCLRAQRKIPYLLSLFVKIISNSSTKPIVLFIEDMQWADNASIELCTQLILESGCTRFYFVCSCRHDGMSQDHIKRMITSANNLGVKVKVVEVTSLDKNTANELTSDLLGLSPRITRPLTEAVHHKTKGNPLFFSRLLMTLTKEGLLRLSLSRRRWEYDLGKIQSRKLPDDVAEFLTNSIGRLPPGVQDALRTLSCFGASAPFSVIQALGNEIGLQLQTSMDIAVAEGFLDKIGGGYRFTHDKLQEAAFNTIDPDDRKLMHSQYGFALCCHALENGNDDEMLFSAVNQVNCGGAIVNMDPEQGSLMASLNLRAGQKAMALSDFANGLSFFEHGISFLPEGHWHDNYDLSLRLHEKAAHCAYACGNHSKLNAFSEEILTFAQSFEDKLTVTYLVVTALCDSSQTYAAIDKCSFVLSQLGENLPAEISQAETFLLVGETREKLLSLSEEDVMNSDQIADESKIMAMKFLSQLLFSMNMSQPALFPIVPVKLVQLSLSHGFTVTPISAVGLAFFGSMLAVIGRIEEGCKVAKLARKLVKHFGIKANEVAGAVIAITTQTISYIEPVQALLDSHIEGHNRALEAGDIRSAALNTVLRGNGFFMCGEKLEKVKDQYEEAHRFMKRHNIHSFALITEPQIRVIYHLMGADESAMGCEKTTASDDRKELYLQERNRFAAMTHYFQRLLASFLERDYETTVHYANKYFEYNFQPWVALVMNVVRAFITGLASFWIYRCEGDPKWLARGIEMKKKMLKWRESSDWNFEHKFHLLLAEEHYCNKQFESAIKSYDKSIKSANTHKFLNDEALGCELAGHFFLETGNKLRSMEYFMLAHGTYHRWGAFGKCSILFQFVETVFHYTPPDGIESQSQQVHPTMKHNETGNVIPRKRDMPS